MTRHLGKPKNVLLSGRIYSTMSKHRKIFNLFKFVDEFLRMGKVFSDTKLPLYLRLLAFSSHLGSFWYFVLDNFLWLIFSNIRSLGSAVNEFNSVTINYLKYVKDQGSFWRLVFHIILNWLYLRRDQAQARELSKKLMFTEDQVIQANSEASEIMKQLLDLRFRIRDTIIDLLHSSIRIVMLWKSLSFAG